MEPSDWDHLSIYVLHFCKPPCLLERVTRRRRSNKLRSAHTVSPGLRNMKDEDQAIRTSGQAPAPAIRVVIVEDQRELREGLAMLINGTPGFRCVGSFRTMEDALRGISREMPDLVL